MAQKKKAAKKAVRQPKPAAKTKRKKSTDHKAAKAASGDNVQDNHKVQTTTPSKEAIAQGARTGKAINPDYNMGLFSRFKKKGEATGNEAGK